MKGSSVPHSGCRFVLPVSVELRHAQYRLGENGHKSNSLHKGLITTEHEVQHDAECGKAGQEFHITLKICPLPKRIQIHICNRLLIGEEQVQKLNYTTKTQIKTENINEDTSHTPLAKKGKFTEIKRKPTVRPA